jgi:aspartate kinase
MRSVVQKFGGTSLGSTERIKEVAKIVAAEKASGSKVTVVVSAMAGATNQLVTLCNEVSTLKSQSNLAEYDAALSSGEVVSAALLALALQEINVNARSVSAWQLPITTNNHYTCSLVENFDSELVEYCLAHDVVPIITGFQGINKGNRITTLGRGGSDTTAALVAAAIKADRCDIYTDVDGVFSADPRIVHNAKMLENVYNLEMLEFAGGGAKVLHPRSVEIAIRYNIPLRIISSFTKNKGTLITSDRKMENNIITGVTYNKNLLKVNIVAGDLDYNNLISILSKEAISIESMINIDKNYQLILPLNCKPLLENILLRLRRNEEIASFEIDTQIAAISIVGFGIKNNPELLDNIAKKLSAIDIKVSMLNISDIKISILIQEEQAEQCLKAVHEYYINGSEGGI